MKKLFTVPDSFLLSMATMASNTFAQMRKVTFAQMRKVTTTKKKCKTDYSAGAKTTKRCSFAVANANLYRTIFCPDRQSEATTMTKTLLTGIAALFLATGVNGVENL